MIGQRFLALNVTVSYFKKMSCKRHLLHDFVCCIGITVTISQLINWIKRAIISTASFLNSFSVQ